MIFLVDIRHEGTEVSYKGVTVTRKDTDEVTALSNLGDPELDWNVIDLVTQYYENTLGATLLTGNGLRNFTVRVAGWRWEPDDKKRMQLRRVRKSNGA